ncbi:MAG: hypothetical protein IJG69_01385 [Spirochaetales bacterium]|nr:hypothetical protein [Spirochaetales bacterium]
MKNSIVNKEHKDRLFKYIFGRAEKKEWLLSLYNAMNHSHHDNPEDITITTLEDVIYISMKNDLSFLIGNTMSFYEHQSTFNPNIPFRMFMYAGRVYSKLVKDKVNRISLYSSIPQIVPVPKLVCFYNGLRDIGESMVLRMSDVLPEWNKADIDATVLMLNINWGRNKELMSSCRPLSEYSLFTADVRQLYSDTGDKDFAVETAIRNLPEDSEIRAFMEENMAEVKEMCLTEYDDEKEKEILKEQYLEAGRKEGRSEGETIGADRMASLGDQLMKAGRTEDLKRVFSDPAYREKLFKEFNI